MITVPSEGPLNAKIIPIGEGPADAEIAQRRPFVGPSGNKLKVFWEPVGLSREQMRIMNVIDFQAPGNELAKVEAEAIVEGIVRLRAEIERLTDPYVIVPMGNYATFAVTGKGDVKAAVRNAFGGLEATAAEKKAGITKLRGSLYEYHRQDGRVVKVIPTIHPAALFRNPKWEKRCYIDWERIAREAQYREIVRMPRTHVTNPTEKEVAEYVEYVEAHPELLLAVDIETWGNQLSCVGFSHRFDWSITIPCVGDGDKWGLSYIARLCNSRCQKILHNGFYDWYWLDRKGIGLSGFVWDTMLMHHALDPAESHSLDFVSSIYCVDHVYWKDEAKDAEEIVKYATDLESLWTYNGIDCCRTRELFDILYWELDRAALVPFYLQHYSAMFEPIVRTMLYGIRVDREAQKAWRKRLKGEMGEIRGYLAEAAGEDLFATERKALLREPTGDEWRELLPKELYPDLLDSFNANGIVPGAKLIDRAARERLNYIMSGKNAGKIRDYKVIDKKDFSGVKLMRFFYETLKLPKQTKIVRREWGKERTDTIDEVALWKLTLKYPQKIKDYGVKLIMYRQKKKEADQMKGAHDADGRVRCAYTMLTEAGRLSSRKNPMGKGMNLQNVKR